MGYIQNCLLTLTGELHYSCVDYPHFLVKATPPAPVRTLEYLAVCSEQNFHTELFILASA